MTTLKTLFDANKLAETQRQQRTGQELYAELLNGARERARLGETLPTKLELNMTLETYTDCFLRYTTDLINNSDDFRNLQVTYDFNMSQARITIDYAS